MTNPDLIHLLLTMERVKKQCDTMRDIINLSVEAFLKIKDPEFLDEHPTELATAALEAIAELSLAETVSYELEKALKDGDCALVITAEALYALAQGPKKTTLEKWVE